MWNKPNRRSRANRSNNKVGKDGEKGAGQGEGKETRVVTKGGSTSTGWEARLTPTSWMHCEPKRDYTLLRAVGRAVGR